MTEDQTTPVQQILQALGLDKRKDITSISVNISLGVPRTAQVVYEDSTGTVTFNMEPEWPKLTAAQITAEYAKKLSAELDD